MIATLLASTPNRPAVPDQPAAPVPNRPHLPDPLPAPVTTSAGVAASAALAEAWAGDPERWQDQVRHVPGTRWYTRLFESAEANAWLITWAPGSAIDLHDHGRSAATVVVVEGELTEHFRTLDDPTTETRHLPPGSSVSFEPDHVHALVNDTDAVAASIHVYSPPLVAMRGIDGEVPANRAGQPGWTEPAPEVGT